MSKGWLKSAAEAGEEIPDEAAKKLEDLAKRVDEVKVTDDMQVRREIAMIEDDHMVEYAKSRPIEDPMQQGMSRPDPNVDLEAAAEFDRRGSMEPPGYMHMSRSNQPMSRFSEGHERFIDELRTDMAEDTNFGELSSRFYDDLESIDKREDLLRSTGKDAGGRQLDDIEISNEYEKLSKERQSLANEYYVAKAEREAELRHEGSYVPRGTPGGGTPGGGEVEDLFPHKNLLDKAQKSGFKIPRHLRGASGKELLDRPVGTPKEFDNPGFVNMIESRGLDTDFLNQLNSYLTTKRNTLKKEYDDYLQSAYSNYPNEINTFALERADELRLELESPFFTGDGGRFYDESRNSIVGDQLIRFANEAEKNRVDFTSIDKVMGLDVKTENFGLKLERALMDEITRPDFYKNPVVQKIKEGFDRMSKESTDHVTMRAQYLALEDMFDDYKDDLVLSKQLLMDGMSYGHNHKRFMQVFQNQYYAKYELVGNRLVKNELPNRTNPIVSRGADSDEMVDYDDFEGPSESEIQQMVSQSQFGDPYQLEMLKENLRRIAEAEQKGQIARSNIRRSRTPGTPGEFSRSTEGTSRAERQGTPRERPKPKKTE